jgi:uncharacterized membrane protein YgdD (TMEM256/DUF423 family)
MRPVYAVFLGAVLGALAVGLGAIGAHALKGHLLPQQLETFHTAVEYQMYHALGLGLIGVLGLLRRNRWLDIASWLMLSGILLFSGFLYMWIATGSRLFVHPVPIGGVAFIVAWLLLAVGALRGEGQRR